MASYLINQNNHIIEVQKIYEYSFMQKSNIKLSAKSHNNKDPKFQLNFNQIKEFSHT